MATKLPGMQSQSINASVIPVALSGFLLTERVFVYKILVSGTNICNNL